MQFVTKTSESFFSWDWYIHRSKAVQKHKQSFWQQSGLRGFFFSFVNKFCPYKLPVGVDLVLHWTGYTTCGSGGGFVGFCQKSPQFCYNGQCKMSPKTFTYRWSSWSCSKYCINDYWHGLALLWKFLHLISSRGILTFELPWGKEQNTWDFIMSPQFSLTDAKLSMGSGPSIRRAENLKANVSGQ